MDRIEGPMMPIVGARPRVTLTDKLIYGQAGAIGGVLFTFVALLVSR